MLRILEVSAVFLLGALVGVSVFWYCVGPDGSGVQTTPSGNAADWASAAASFCAAVVALWIALKQQSRDRAICKFHQYFDHGCWRLTLISEGLVPATVVGVYLVRAGIEDLDLLQFNKSGSIALKNIGRGSAENIINIESAGFSSLVQGWGAPYLERLKSEGYSPADYELVTVDERYFKRLQQISNKTFFVRVVTLRQRYKIKAPRHLVSDLVDALSTDLREQREQEIRNHTGRA